MKSTNPKQLHTTDRAWYIVDAEGKTLGRLATEVAVVLTGKHKPEFSNHIDVGDYVIITNANKFTVTGAKMDDKLYYTHSRYQGHLRQQTLAEKLEKKPTHALQLAISGMLPKNKLRPARLDRLKLFVGTDHDHAAQAPVPLHV